MCPPPKTYDRLAGVTIAGSLGDIAGDVIGGDKITYGIDEERLTAILERIILRGEGGSVLLSRGAGSQSTIDHTQQSVPRRPSGLKRDLISQLSGALQELVDLIADLDNDRDIAFANTRLSEWKQKTDRVVNSSFESGNLNFEMRLYDIIPDANQRTPFNKIKNESRKCQKAIMDLLRELQ